MDSKGETRISRENHDFYYRRKLDTASNQLTQPEWLANLFSIFCVCSFLGVAKMEAFAPTYISQRWINHEKKPILFWPYPAIMAVDKPSL
jgi:hypothetical protein